MSQLMSYNSLKDTAKHTQTDLKPYKVYLKDIREPIKTLTENLLHALCKQTFKETLFLRELRSPSIFLFL